MPRNVGFAALDIARHELGQKENPAGSNRGPRPYMDGRPWCATFVTYCLDRSGWTPKDFNTAYCPSWVNAAKTGHQGMKILPPGSRPVPGDLALFDWQHDGVSDHIGFIESVQSAFAFTTLEGNTSVGNDSNGGQVMRRSRTRGQTLCIVRLPAVKLTLRQRVVKGLTMAKFGSKSVRILADKLTKK